MAINAPWALLVDGDATVRGAVSTSLQAICAIASTASGRRALMIAGQQGPDLLITEYRLPDISGLDLVRHVRTVRPRLPVLILTGYGSEEVCAAALRLGVRDYFRKPFDARELRASVAAILTSAGQTPERPTATGADRRPLARAATPLMQRALEFLDEHYPEPISLLRLARHLGLSRFATSRAFQRGTRISFRGYLLQLRVARAQDLLTGTAYPVTQVAQMVGFSDLPRFDKVFKRLTGTTPQAYRASATSDNRRARNY